MDIVEISTKRYTTKHYNSSKKIPQEKIEQLCQVLKNTPSSVNSQPWHFIVISSDEWKNKIIPAVSDFNHLRVTDASHIVIFCAKKGLDDAHLQNLLNQEDKDGRYPDVETKIMIEQARKYFVGLNSETQESALAWETKQIYIALGQLLFASAAISVDSTPIEGFNIEEMDNILGLSAKGLTSVVIASLGYRAENDSNAKRPKSRLPIEQTFTFL